VRTSGFDGAKLLDNGGSYTIALSGAEPVPEPSSVLGTLALGALLLGLSAEKSRKTNQHKPVRVPSFVWLLTTETPLQIV